MLLTMEQMREIGAWDELSDKKKMSYIELDEHCFEALEYHILKPEQLAEKPFLKVTDASQSET